MLKKISLACVLVSMICGSAWADQPKEKYCDFTTWLNMSGLHGLCSSSTGNKTQLCHSFKNNPVKFAKVFHKACMLLPYSYPPRNEDSNEFAATMVQTFAAENIQMPQDLAQKLAADAMQKAKTAS